MTNKIGLKTLVFIFILVSLFAMSAVFYFGFWYGSRTTKSGLSSADWIYENKQIRSGQFEFINPLLECDSDISFTSLRPFEKSVEQVIRKYPEFRFGVYFRDLENGYWFGVNERETFIPASMVKVPTLIKAYKVQENDPDFFDDEVVYDDKYIDLRNLGPTLILKKGERYKVRELIDQVAIHSDNEANQVLMDLILERFENVDKQVNKHFGIEKVEDEHTVKSYSSFFRILYNSSYLNQTSSNEILKLLSQADFAQGIVRPIPPVVPVAHKFGYYDSQVSAHVQFQHCGIIYFPYKPYLLCVTSKGKKKSDLSSLMKVVSDISEVVYAEVSNQVEFEDFNQLD